MHNAESYSSPFLRGPSRHGTPGPVYRYTLYDYGGEKLDQYRSASVHTPVDSYGWRAPTGYYAYRKTEYRPRVNYSFNGGYFGENYVYAVSAPAEPNWTMLNQLLAEAETLALAKFGSGSVDLSVAFLERKQTANMITDWCSATTRMLRDLRKGRWERAWKTGSTKVWKWNKGVPRGWTPEALRQWRSGRPITAVKNAWLTTRYGIAPSLMDIAGSVEAIENADNGTFDRYIVSNRSRRYDAVSYATPDINSYVGAFWPMQIKQHDTIYRKHEAMVRLDATIDDSFYLRLNDVGLSNPLLTGWEVTPYSFVVDWFIGVGDFLSAVNAFTGGYKFKAGSVTRFWDLSTTRYAVPFGWAGQWNGKLEMDHAPHCANRGFTRTVYGSAPFPSMVAKRDPLNFERMWDSIFLLANVTGNTKAATRVSGRQRSLRI